MLVLTATIGIKTVAAALVLLRHAGKIFTGPVNSVSADALLLHVRPLKMAHTESTTLRLAHAFVFKTQKTLALLIIIMIMFPAYASVLPKIVGLKNIGIPDFAHANQNIVDAKLVSTGIPMLKLHSVNALINPVQLDSAGTHIHAHASAITMKIVPLQVNSLTHPHANAVAITKHQQVAITST